MSDLFDHLADLYARGHAREVPDLIIDHRHAEGDRQTPAAVLIAVVDKPTGPSVLLTQRPRGMRDHPGQVALPGGKLEPGEDAVEAALREAGEELGIRANHVRVIGATDLYLTGTGFAVTPVLGVVPDGLAIEPDPREVAAWFDPPLAHLLDRDNWIRRSAMWNGQERFYLDMQYGEFRIWGVTAAILFNLSRRIAWQS